MRIGIFGGEVAGAGGLDDVVASAKEAADQGFASYWLPQVFSLDALTTLAILGRDVPGIELGTAVVPTYPRHPMMLAQQALTTQAASGGRLLLGIGLSHQIVIEGMYGMSFDKPLRHMREYLKILVPLVHDGSVSFTGETLTANGSINIPGATPFPILLAALGPKMLRTCGQRRRRHDHVDDGPGSAGEPHRARRSPRPRSRRASPRHECAWASRSQ